MGFAKVLKRRGVLWGAGVLMLFIAIAAINVRVDYNGHREGVYLLKGLTTRYELTDDVMLGEETRIIAGMSWDVIYGRLGVRAAQAHGEPHLEYEWFASDGSGFVRNILPDGRQLLTCLSRFRDVDGSVFKGVFVGGGLPYHEHGDKAVTLNDTGMAYYDGKEWHHIWCNVNESIAIGAQPTEVVSPSLWEFLGSRVVEANEQRVILASSHRVVKNGVNLRIDRYAVFQAGESFFILVNKVQNAGGTPGNYYYTYGDEPWVGEYGTSTGNVGWVEDRLFPYEGEVPVGKYTYAGMFDCGNRAANEPAGFTGLANFIEWLGIPPNLVYFSNKIGAFAPESAKVPLASPDNRVIFLQWGPRLLQPGQTDLYILAIGMAGSDGRTGYPVKPTVALDPQVMATILAH